MIGMAIKERFARENKPGVLSYLGYDAWWNGGLRSVPAFHNMHGILTETAGNLYATPRTYKPPNFRPRFTNGMPTREPSMFYERPWMGGKWGVRDAIDYMLTADFAILNLAAARRADYLLKSYQWRASRSTRGSTGKPYAYVIPAEQWDRPTALEMLERLAVAGIEVRRARAAFQADGKSYPKGAYVLPAAQPFRAYLMDLLEPQNYPSLGLRLDGSRSGLTTSPAGRCRMQMGVLWIASTNRSRRTWRRRPSCSSEGVVTGDGPVVILDHSENAAVFAHELLSRAR